MIEALKSLASQPLMLIGVVIMVASLATSVEFMGVSVDPDKWIAGVVCSFALMGISLWRNRK